MSPVASRCSLSLLLCPLSPWDVPTPVLPVSPEYHHLPGVSPFPWPLCPGVFPIPLVCAMSPVTSACVSPHVVPGSPRCPHSPSVPWISLVPMGVLIPRFRLPGEIPCLSGVFPSSPRCSHPKSPVTPGVSLVPPSPQRVVPEDADGLGALLGLQQPELESDRFGQRLGGPRAPHAICARHVHADAHHRCVDDGALGHPEVHQGQGAHSGCAKTHFGATECPGTTQTL